MSIIIVYKNLFVEFEHFLGDEVEADANTT